MSLTKCFPVLQKMTAGASAEMIKDKLDIFTRCHTVLPPKPKSALSEAEVPKWPPYILAFDTETTENLELALEFGAYQYCSLGPDGYMVEEEGLIYADNLDERSLSVLREYAEKHGLRLHSRRKFVEYMLWPTLRAGGALVAFNLGFDISRIAVHWSDRRDGSGFTFYLSDYWNRKRKRWEISRLRPGIVRTSIDSKKSFYAIGYMQKTDREKGVGLSEEEIREFTRARFLDVRTLAFTLTNTSHSLKSLCKTLGAPPPFCKSEYVSGPISPKKISYCRQDVAATVWCLNKLREEFDRHSDLTLHPDRAYSPVSLAKSYLFDMGLVHPAKKFDVSPDILGSAMEAFYAGRTECKIRRTKTPVVYCDLASAYPSCNALQRNWDVLTAESLSLEDGTQGLRDLLEQIVRDPFRLLLDRSTWPKLRSFARIKPNGDILPLRCKYDDEGQNIGFNYAYGNRSIYYSAFDLAVSVLLTGKVPLIKSAFKVVPHGKQTGLRKVRLRGEIPIDPIKDDFYQFVTEERARVKKTNEPLADFLKCIGNGGAFGLFAQIDPRVEPEEVIVKVYAGSADPFPSATVNTEYGGRWFFPILASWITSGAHLLLALVERLVTDAGGVIALMDTDSAAIVSTQEGGLVPCPGGSYRLPDGCEALRALSWDVVREKVVKPLRALNPYRGVAGKESVLKVEKENYGPDGQQRQLFAYSVSSKRYCMFIENERGEREIVKASAHGLGYLYPPYECPESWKNKEHPWIWEAWEYILAMELDGDEVAMAKHKPWFDLPAMMQVAITTPAVIARFKGMIGFRPLNFMLAPMLMGGISNGSQAKLCLVTQFTKDRSKWKTAIYRDIATGNEYTLFDADGPDKPCQIDPMCYGGIINNHRFHPEPKFRGPDGQPCGRNARGLLHRRHVQIGRKVPIRKETNRRWTEGNDPSILEMEQTDSTATEYVRMENKRKHTTHAVASPRLREWMGRVPLNLISWDLGIKKDTMLAVREGKPVRPEVLVTLMEVKRLWIIAEQHGNGALESALDLIRRSRRDYRNGGGLRDFLKLEKKLAKMR